MYKISTANARLAFFSICTILVTYGFALTNYSLTVDNEVPAYPDSSLSLGRWGTNLIHYHIFHGHDPYITLLLSLLILGVAAASISDIFKLRGLPAYIFCGLFLTFPQMAYQMVFIMQSVGIALGFLLSAVAIKLFIKSSHNFLALKSVINLVAGAFILMFVIAIYQGLVLIPVVIYLIYLFQNTYLEDYTFKGELKKALYFGAMMFLALVLYYISTKILCPPTPEGSSFLASYLAGSDTTNPFVRFFGILTKNFAGSAFYGNRMFALATLAAIALIVKFAIGRKHFLMRSFLLLFIIIAPYIFSLFITNGYHPPRIYLTSGIVFAFIIVHLISDIKYEQQIVWVCSVICLVNIYFVSTLYYAANRISNRDKEVAKKMDALIQSKYPEFNPTSDYVFFYGGLPYEHQNEFALPDSEIFGGSIFNWDNGSNFRIICLFKAYDIANFRYLDNKDLYLKAKEKVATMPVWPSKESVDKVDNVVIVKLNNQEGMPLF